MRMMIDSADLLDALLFGVTYMVVFIVVEGAVASKTNWGMYRKLGPCLWQTPIVLLPIWVIMISIISWAVSFVEMFSSHALAALSAMLLMFLLNTGGEAFGRAVGFWSYSPRQFKWLGVPLWIPLSYSLAFAACPWLSQYPIGGGIQAAIVGGTWLLFNRVIP